MTRTRLNTRIATAVIAGAALAAAPAALGSTSILATGGTTVVPDAGTFGALADAEVGVAPTGAAMPGPAGITFPITVGKVDLKALKGEIRHVGGLTLAAENGPSVNLSRYFIDLTNGNLTAQVRVNGKLAGRVPVFDVTFPNGPMVDLKGRNLTVKGVHLDLTEGAAALLRDTFGADKELVNGDTKIGVATVQTRVFPIFHW
jgi:hypothetical protein